MSSRQRGAVWFLALLLCGRSLDFFALPFVVRPQRHAAPDSLATDTAASLAGTVAGARDTLAPAAAVPPPPLPLASGLPTPDAVPVAINRASVAELQRLPRVGPVLAGRIVAERAAHGPFRSAADLQRVHGIGPRTAARLAPLVRFD